FGNYVGTDSSGSLAVSNSIGGAFVGGGSRSNVIGGAMASARNVFSGNRDFGLWLGGVGTRPNTLLGMYVIDGASSNAVIGNVFSGNASEGLRLTGANVSGNLVQGNFCGT